MDNAPTSPTFAVNAPQVAHELMDGEIVIIDFGSGCYYSAEGATAAAWIWLTSGVDVKATARALAAGQTENHDTIEADVGRFAARCLDLRLLVATSGVEAVPPKALDFDPGEYTTLALAQHSDVADLLLLDPVHDVGLEGWPRPASSQT